jgi:tRNA nucleotidyltransferase (CCA-adding enzyme)
MMALLGSNDFRIVDHAFHVSDTIQLAVELESLNLSPGRKHIGPPMWIDNASSFLERWNREGMSKPFLENGHWVVIAPRDHPEAAGLLHAKLATAALGSAFRDLKGLRIQSGDASINEKNRAVLSGLLDKRMRWEV